MINYEKVYFQLQYFEQKTTGKSLARIKEAAEMEWNNLSFFFWLESLFEAWQILKGLGFQLQRNALT